MRRDRELVAASAAAVLCAVIAVAVPIELVRVLAALPLALFLPGYAVMKVAFGSQWLAPPLAFAASLGSSLSLLALSGILLDVLPGGIETLTWALLLVAIVLGCCGAAALRRGSAPASAGHLAIPRLAGRDLALLGAAVVVAVGAFVLAQTPLPASHATGYTALWMVPSGAQERAVEVGVVSSEQQREDYVLRVDVGATAPQVSRFSLDPGQERTTSVAVPPPTAGGSTFVSASLYQADEPGHLYRRVVSWLPRKAGLP